MRETFRLAISQMTSTDDIANNLRVVEILYRQAVAAGAELVVFPENTLGMRIVANRPSVAIGLAGAECAALTSLVDEMDVELLLTTAVAAIAGGKMSNSTLHFKPGAPVHSVYQKIHLFDVDVVGAPPVRESDQFLPGREPTVVEVQGWKFGLSICYDLRFAELYLRYSQKVDVILIPSAFLVPTGETHWHVLNRARAIESQCYVAAPAQSGEHFSQVGSGSRQTYGHSLLVDPWGQVVGEWTQSPSVNVVELKRETIDQVRRQIPMGGHRRL